MASNAKSNAQCGAIYGLGFIGAAIYYISAATTFWLGVIGILKSLVWPAFLVYELLSISEPDILSHIANRTRLCHQLIVKLKKILPFCGSRQVRVLWTYFVLK